MKDLLRCALLGIALSAAPAVLAQSFPVKGKPIRIIVPYAPGGVADLLSRIVGQRLGPAYGTQIVIDNRPGAGGNIGTALAAKSAPDGHTLVLVGIHFVANPSLYAAAAHDPLKDFTPVTRPCCCGRAARRPNATCASGRR